MTKHVGYYLENVSEQFANDLNEKLLELDLEDCFNLQRWLIDQTEEEARDLIGDNEC
jgi:hypothetical protein